MATTEIRQRDVKLENSNGIHSSAHVQEVIVPNVEPKQTSCGKIRSSCTSCCIPCLSSHNPLPENPTFFDRLRYGLMLPPHGNLAWYLQFVIVSVQIWIVLYALTHDMAVPGGNIFSLLILFICCAIAGYFTSFVKLPPLLGMLILGVMLRNLPGVKVIGENIDSKWSGALRKIALTVIVTRAGLGLDVVKLRKLSWAVLRLAFIPCSVEIITGAVVSHFVLGFPWIWSMLLGCILGALSPAVTVPILVNLQDRRYGVAKGIPTMLLAAGGLDNVLCITCFSVFMGIIFSEGNMAVTIVKGPLGVVVGILYGFVMGFLLWYIPSKDSPNQLFYRTMMLLSAGLIAIFGSSEIGLSGAGPLGCLTTAVVAAYKWRQRRQPGEPDEQASVMLLMWLIVQHFLFGLIGSAVNISVIDGNLVGYGVMTLFIGLVVRSIASSTVTMGTGFNRKERVFVTMTWLAKATVQAAIGGLALDRVREMTNPDAEMLRYGQDVLTLSVLAIVICAPTGAILMSLFGPRFLVNGDDDDSFVDVRVEGDKDSQSEPVKAALPIDDSQNEQDTLDEPINLYKSQLSISLASNKPRSAVKVSTDDSQDVLDKLQNEVFGIDNPVFDASGLYENVDHTSNNVGDVDTASDATDIAAENVEETSSEAAVGANIDDRQAGDASNTSTMDLS